jgi:hypothetical protein
VISKRVELSSAEMVRLPSRHGSFGAPGLRLRMVLRHSKRSAEHGPPKKAKLCNQARQLISPFQFVDFEVSDLSNAMRKQLIRIIKKAKPQPRLSSTESSTTVDATKWSRAVRSWVAEFQQNAKSESLPAFDSLFQTTNHRLS